MKLRSEEQKTGAGGEKRRIVSRKAMVLSGLMLILPLYEACSTSEAAPARESAIVSCPQEQEGTKQKMTLGDAVSVKLAGRCNGESLEGVDLTMKCGSHRFQQSCTLNLAVPAEMSFVSGTNNKPLRITVERQAGGSAKVTLEKM